MDKIFFLKIEIITFFLSLFYVIYFLLEKVYIIYFNVKKLISPDKKIFEDKVEKIQQIIKEKDNKILKKKKTVIKKLNDKDFRKIADILKRIHLNTEKGYLDTSKALIIEGLAIDKYNKALNIELAKIYEIDKNYVKAEYIYIDLLKAYEDNFEILKKLGFNLALQRKFEESIKIFIEAHKKRKDDSDVVEILADLTYEMNYYKKSLKYIKLYLKQFPRSTEKMKMKAYCFEMLGDTHKAIEIYKKVIELQPYNSQVLEKLKHLEG